MREAMGQRVAAMTPIFAANNGGDHGPDRIDVCDRPLERFCQKCWNGVMVMSGDVVITGGDEPPDACRVFLAKGASNHEPRRLPR
jgi:hypothetical protein